MHTLPSCERRVSSAIQQLTNARAPAGSNDSLNRGSCGLRNNWGLAPQCPEQPPEPCPPFGVAAAQSRRARVDNHVTAPLVNTSSLNKRPTPYISIAAETQTQKEGANPLFYLMRTLFRPLDYNCLIRQPACGDGLDPSPTGPSREAPAHLAPEHAEHPRWFESVRTVDTAFLLSGHPS